jgi:uncharacterized protein YdeI (YjbR/CyaY-like superfamily)
MVDLMRQTELKEEIKWSMPCYTFGGKNVAMIAAFKEYCTISFFKGSLLKDPAGILTFAGENSQSAKLFKVTSLQQLLDHSEALLAYVKEAIALEQSGAKVQTKSANEYPLPEELVQKLEEDPQFKTAFFALTPGRQRGYIIHFNGAKQSQTRFARIEKCTPAILQGKGMND